VLRSKPSFSHSEFIALYFSEETRAVHVHLFPRTQWLTTQYFAAHPDETEISGPRLMDWARQTYQKPIRGMDRDEILEKIRAWIALTASEA
jgi:hypothetical protein